MPDIVTSKIFVDGEKGITATKMNQIISGAVIQSDFYTNKATSSTLDPTDTLLELKNTGSYAQIAGSQLINSIAASLSQSVVPTGSVLDYGGASAPTGWLLCDGSAASRVTYVNLFNALTIQTTGNTVLGSSAMSVASTTNMVVGMPISGPGIPAGTTIAAIGTGTITLSANATATGTGVAIVVAPFGVGDGSTTFNVPDCRGRVLVGAGTGSGLTNRVLAVTGGEETHALSIPELPAHSHTNSPHSHSTTAGNIGSITVTAGPYNVATYQTIQTGAASVPIDNTGGNGAHNTMQPFIGLNKIIKT